MWTYSQSTGALSHDGTPVGKGYSGHGDALNNPASEDQHGKGPTPRGPWKIGAWEVYHQHLGLCVAPLSPVGFDPHGRSEFFIHGDNALMNHTASDGCIILAKDIREKMRDSRDHDLTVTE